jgi:phage terminase small subunit
LAILKNHQHEFFCQQILAGKNSTDAAIAAGYKPAWADKQGSRLRHIPHIEARIQELMAKAADRAELNAARVLEELRRLAFADVRKLFDKSGNLLPVHSLDAEHAAAIAGFEIIKKNAFAGDGVIDTIHKVRSADKLKALELLAKHFGLLIEKVDHSGEILFRWQSPGE